MIMNIVRIAKVVALLAFVLPWAAVSCNGTDLATASGIELIQGTMSQNPQASEQMAAAMGLPGGATTTQEPMTPPAMEMNIFALGAAVVIVVGLGLTFLGRIAPVAALVTSLLAAGLVYGAVWQFKQEIMKSDMAQEQGGGGLSGSPFGPGPGDMAAMNQFGANIADQLVQERIGFWLAIGGLLAAAGASGIALASRSSGGGGASVRPDSM
jgi:uncharacterized membrane protein YphA (DoxX/SURF4 family)